MSMFPFTDKPVNCTVRYSPDPARIALRELLDAIAGVQTAADMDALAHARLVLAMNSARNVLNKR